MIEYAQLTKKQQILYNYVMDSLPERPTYGAQRQLTKTMELLISGVAGAGKTTLVALVVRDLIIRKYKVFMVAPTHQATQELSKAFKGGKMDIDVVEQVLVSETQEVQSTFQVKMETTSTPMFGAPVAPKEPKFVGTIHSALGLKMTYNEDKQSLTSGGMVKTSTRNSWSKHVEYECDVLFCDEGSMVSPVLRQLVIDGQAMDFYHAIFIGDRYQLEPPDGDGSQSTVFDIPTPTLLDEVTRQAAGSPIIRFSEQCRKKIDYFMGWHNVNPAFTFAEFLDADNMIKLPMHKVVDEYVRMVDNDCTKSTNYRILSYTNKRVDMFNSAIRARLLGDDIDEIVQGENILLKGSSPDMTFSNNQEVHVKFCERTEIVLSLPKDITEKGEATRNLEKIFEGFSITLESTGSGEKVMESFEILSSRGREEFDHWIGNFRKLYGRMKTDVSKRASSVGWREYWALVGKMPDFTYPYASTVHKSQGSTFNEVIFDLETIKPLFRIAPATAWRLIYVAATRPRFKVWFAMK